MTLNERDGGSNEVNGVLSMVRVYMKWMNQKKHNLHKLINENFLALSSLSRGLKTELFKRISKGKNRAR